MKTILYTNWILLGVYTLYCMYGLFGADSPGMDAAGRGMAKGFALVGLMIIIILALLNLINSDWVRMIILIICLIPVVMAVKQVYHVYQYNRLYANGPNNARAFEDPHLKNIMRAVDGVDVGELKRLLDEDDKNINVPGVSGYTVLHIAVLNLGGFEVKEKTEIVRLLLDHGGDLNIPYTDGSSVVANIAANVNFDTFKMLLDGGADPNGKDGNGVAIIYQLVRDHWKNDYDKLDLLLEMGADPNMPFGTQGWTLNYSVLLFAASNKHWRNCELLIDHGADLHFKPQSGQDFFDYYRRYKAEYMESDGLPDDFVNLTEHPIVKEAMSSL